MAGLPPRGLFQVTNDILSPPAQAGAAEYADAAGETSERDLPV
jgi:hypothetical protein